MSLRVVHLWTVIFTLVSVEVVPFCDSANAALIGNNFEISGPGCRFPDVAYDCVDGKYLVVWPDYNVSLIQTVNNALKSSPCFWGTNSRLHSSYRVMRLQLTGTTTTGTASFNRNEAS